MTDARQPTEGGAQTSRRDSGPVGAVWQPHDETGNKDRSRRHAGPVLTLAYDNGLVNAKPGRQQTAGSPGITLLLGVFFIAESFGPFLMGIELLSNPFAPEFFAVLRSMSEGALQSLILLQLVVGGNLVLFATGTEQGFFPPPFPPLRLLAPILFAQLATTLLCGAGWLVEPIPWQVIACVWVYNLLWILVLRGVWLAGGRLADFLRERPRGKRRQVPSVSVATPAGNRAEHVPPYLIHTTRGTEERPG